MTFNEVLKKYLKYLYCLYKSVSCVLRFFFCRKLIDYSILSLKLSTRNFSFTFIICYVKRRFASQCQLVREYNICVKFGLGALFGFQRLTRQQRRRRGAVAFSGSLHSPGSNNNILRAHKERDEVCYYSIRFETAIITTRLRQSGRLQTRARSHTHARTQRHIYVGTHSRV